MNCMGAPPRTTELIDGIPVVPGSKFALRPQSYRHGTRSAYVAGCACSACTEAATRYVKEKRHKSLGRPVRPYTPARKKEP